MGKELESFWLRLKIWNCLLVYAVNANRINRKLHVIIYWLNRPWPLKMRNSRPPPPNTHIQTSVNMQTLNICIFIYKMQTMHSKKLCSQYTYSQNKHIQQSLLGLLVS